MDEQGINYDGAAIPTSDVIPSEMVILYDKNNPPMYNLLNRGVQDDSATICHQ